MAVNHVIKDNFTFGVVERHSSFKNKVSNEDNLRNVDAQKEHQKTCDFWLKFENGVRLLIEMQDSLRADTDKIPPSNLPIWLVNKIEEEERKLQGAKSEEDFTDKMTSFDIAPTDR